MGESLFTSYKFQSKDLFFFKVTEFEPAEQRSAITMNHLLKIRNFKVRHPRMAMSL